MDQVIQELRPKLAGCAGNDDVPAERSADPHRRIQSKALYQFTLQARTPTDLFSASQDFLAKMQKLPGLQDVTSDLQIKNPQINVDDRPRQSLGAGRDGQSN